MTEAKKSVYETLSQIDVKSHVEKKDKFDYLSWAWAVHELRTACPTATWEVKHFSDAEFIATAPYMKTDCGYFVEVAVTVEGITLSQIHPVLDHRNKSVEKPNAFQINTSIQRCLVKAIALHGLGLSLYAGEDLPTEPKKEDKPKDDKNFKFLQAMVAQQERVGDDAFYKIVGGAGFEKAKDIKKRAEQETVFKALCDLPNKGGK
jgi:hypothetical protein